MMAMVKFIINSTKSKLGFMDVRKFVKYSLVGVVNTAVFYGIYFMLLQVGVWYVISLTIGNVAAVFNSYIMNKVFTFKTKEKSLRESMKFFVVAGVQYVLNLLVVHFCVGYIGLSAELAGFIAICISVFMSYFGHKLWTFKGADCR
jgi:putative flippase GtrA